MRIKWVGVPKEFRAKLRIACAETLETLSPGSRQTESEFLVCSDKGATKKTLEYIRDSLWAFNPEFIVSHTLATLDQHVNVVKALRLCQQKLCEDANDLVYAMIATNYTSFCQHAIMDDGRGHFLAQYDGKEHIEYFALAGLPARTFYIYRQN